MNITENGVTRPMTQEDIPRIAAAMVAESRPVMNTLTRAQRDELESAARRDIAVGSASSSISAHDDNLARDMACFLWECSQLRHGLFTPAEFIPLVSSRLREYLVTRALPNVKVDS